jgi:hypothetical protein
MTSTSDTVLTTAGTGAVAGIESFDLTPEGLANTPAHEEDSGSLVHTGNS